MAFVPKKGGAKNWTVFIITHKNIFPWLYAKDPDFNPVNYQFVNISSRKIKPTNLRSFKLIDLPQKPGFVRLGDYYFESEAIYNIYKNPALYRKLDYIGFIHYDFELKSADGSYHITRRIGNYLSDKTKAHISFSTNNALAVYNLMLLADENQPNTPCGSGYNCIDYILRDYNHFFHTNYTLDDIFRKQNINMCSSFLIDLNTFIKMMAFIAYVIESKKLDVFDTQHQYTIQGHFLERYYAVFLLFEFEQYLESSLPHHSFLKKIL